MAILVNEPFNAMANGPGVPPGWHKGGPSGTVFEFGTSPGGEYPGFKWYRTPSPGGFGSPDFDGDSTQITVWLGWRNFPGTAVGATFPELQLYMPLPGYNPLAPFSDLTKLLNIFTLRGEVDTSLSLVSGVKLGGGGLLNGGAANTGRIGTARFYPQYTWFWTQLNLTATEDAFGVISLDAELVIEGEIVADGTCETSVNTSSLDLFRFCVFLFDGFGQIDLSQIIAEDMVAVNSYPNPGTPFIRATQMLNEVAMLPDDDLVRVSQMVNEVAKLPDNARVRISQMVIELAAVGATPSGTGLLLPEYIKGRPR